MEENIIYNALVLYLRALATSKMFEQNKEKTETIQKMLDKTSEMIKDYEKKINNKEK